MTPRLLETKRSGPMPKRCDDGLQGVWSMMKSLVPCGTHICNSLLLFPSPPTPPYLAAASQPTPQLAHTVTPATHPTSQHPGYQTPAIISFLELVEGLARCPIGMGTGPGFRLPSCIMMGVHLWTNFQDQLICLAARWGGHWPLVGA